MGANLSGKDIANGDFMIKTCAADPEAGYAKEKFHADPKNGVVISEVDGPKGKRLEFSADWSVVSLDTKLQEGENIEISEDQVSGKVEISAPNVGKVKTDSEDTFGYLEDKIFGTFPIIKKQISVDGVKSVVIESAEKIAFSEFNTKWEGSSYSKGFFDNRAISFGKISNSAVELYGVNFCVEYANAATIRFDYSNMSGGNRTLNLYATYDITDWSNPILFPLELETTNSGTLKTAEIELAGILYDGVYFLLVFDDYDEEVSDITIFNIYRYKEE